MEVLKAALVAFLLLLSGDFIATFFYHVPEHIFGKFHTVVHHSQNRSFIRYAVLNKNPIVLISGFLAALPYLIFIPWFWSISEAGTVLGLLFAEFHVLWRHSAIVSKNPNFINRICNFLCITTPDRHLLHHGDVKVGYGDIFTFYDQPAQVWFRVLLLLKRKLRKTRRSIKMSSSSF